ncbi:MAG TPA: rod shape-determining protein MreC [Patescibacteria group bacterium]|jgi:rod shape-determining protein MreC|nr:rod shape-determining protein MreC [Patescibacteria group bacterium]
MKFIYTKTFARLFAGFVLISLFIISDAKGYLSPGKNFIINAYGSGASRLRQGSLNVRSFFATIFTIKNLASENATLAHQIDELSFENARLQSAKQENLALRKALNFQEQSKLKLVAAQVLNFDPSGFTQTLTINKGSADGVAEGLAVIVSPGLLVGKVTKAYSASSEVTMITDPSVTVNAEVSESGAKGLIRGEHGLSLRFDLVTQNEVIKPQDQLITSGLSEDFPRGLLIGEIVSISSSASELFQKAFVSPGADLRNLKFLFVIQKP